MSAASVDTITSTLESINISSPHLTRVYTPSLGDHYIASHTIPNHTLLFEEYPILISQSYPATHTKPLVSCMNEMTLKLLEYSSLTNAQRNNNVGGDKSHADSTAIPDRIQHAAKEAYDIKRDGIPAGDEKNIFTHVYCPSSYTHLKSPIPEYYSDQAWSRATSQIDANAFEIMSSSTTKSVVLYIRITVFNHSCYPNAIVIRDDDMKSRVYAIDEIKQGDQVCICYRPDLLMLPTSLRQSSLHEKWSFTCQCIRCTASSESDISKRDAPLTATTKDVSAETLRDIESQHDTFMTQSSQPTKNWLKSCEKWMNDVPLQNAHWRKHQLREQMIQVYFGSPTPAAVFKPLIAALSHHITSMALILPPYHNSKLRYYNTYIHVMQKNNKKQEDIEKSLIEWDSNSADVRKWYGMK